jgi:phosphoribosylglycinamide formyltransferase-1
MMRKRIAVFASGSGSNLKAMIDSYESGLLHHGEIVLVIGSRQGIGAFEHATRHGIESLCLAKGAFESSQAYDEALLQHLRNHQIDIIVLAGYLSILSMAVIAEYPKRILNVHPALIPSFCGKGFYGMHVHEAVYNSGVKVTGATVHFVDAGIDTGAILTQESVAITQEDTPQSIQKKVLAIEHRILPRAVEALCAERILWKGTNAFIGSKHKMEECL